MSAEIPIACYLTDKQLQARRKNYLDKAAEFLVDSTELPDGFQLAAEPQKLAQAVRELVAGFRGDTTAITWRS